MSTAETAYGWSAEAPHSCDYLAEPILQVLRAGGARRVLDLGCGNGHLCAQLRAAGHEVVGMEPDAGGAALARRANPGLPVYRLGVDDDPRRLLADEAPFDHVVCTEVVEHLYAPRRLPRFAAEVLLPGGRLVVTTPYHGYWKNLALALAGRWDPHFTALWDGGHIKFFSRATLATLLAEAGFEPVGFQGVGRWPGLWKSMLMVGRKPG